jgi:hypothetical protein
MGAAARTALLRILTSQKASAEERRVVQHLMFKGLVLETTGGLALSERGRAIAMEEARRRNLLTERER